MVRSFSFMGKKENQEKKKDDGGYEDEFEDLLNQGKVTEKQTAEFERRKQEKAANVLEDQKRAEEMRAKDQKKTEDAFDDFASGKITDDMNLQDIFKQYYGKAKKVDVSGAAGGIKNSAMSSLGGFSQKLEERRRKAREAKEAKATKAEEDKMSASDEKKEETASTEEKKTASKDNMKSKSEEASAEAEAGKE